VVDSVSHEGGSQVCDSRTLDTSGFKNKWKYSLNATKIYILASALHFELENFSDYIFRLYLPIIPDIYCHAVTSGLNYYRLFNSNR
jgi:hypothetical protein